MAVSALNRAQAFSGECDLWIVPDKTNFNLFSKLDWYLNFQLTRASMHQSQAISPQLKNLIHENRLPNFYQAPPKNSALMVSAELGLPTKTIIEIPSLEDLSLWPKTVHEKWLNLDRPNLRVFLPNSLSLENFNKHWPGTKHEDIDVVPAQ